MTLIEGVGDEVLNFFIIVGVLFVGWVAWCSTNIADQPLIRTVLILQHRTRTRLAAMRSANQANNGGAAGGGAGGGGHQVEQRIIAVVQQQQQQQQQQQSGERSGVGSGDGSGERSEESGRRDGGDGAERDRTEGTLTAATQPSTDAPASTDRTNEEELIQAMDALSGDDVALMREEKKLERAESVSETKEEGTEAEEKKQQEELAEEQKICIKLKFINDDQRMVEGRLKELLGDFKRRHFQLELESRKLVRLVFNGQVLQPDSVTLEQCGFFNNCVVHCLIHQPRPAQTPPNTINSSSRILPQYLHPPTFQNMPAGAGLGSAQTDWDLSRLLVSMVTLILGLAWYFRYHYAQLFTVTSTVGLFGLTAIFTVSLFGHLFPDQDTIRNIE